MHKTKKQKTGRTYLQRAAALLTVTVCLCIAMTGCSMRNANIPSGYLEKTECYDPDGFQDYTDYCKYVYADASQFSGDKKYK